MHAGGWEQEELHQSSSRLLVQSRPPLRTRQRGWVKELTTLSTEEIIEEFTHLANTDCWPTLCRVLCPALAGIPGGEAECLAWRWDEGSAKLQSELGEELKF